MLSFNTTTLVTAQTKFQHLFHWLHTNWMTAFCCCLLVYLLAAKNITLQISFNNTALTTTSSTPTQKTPVALKAALPTTTNRTLTAQQKKQLAYVKRFAKVAQGEMHKYGIPASIKLAQGLLESQAGESTLATKNNNHFGIKCFSKSCQKGHCRNFSDDSHKDFFKVYPAAWDSYRAHSLLLQGQRYRHLKTSANGYREWAIGLKKAGYATDAQYAEKLIQLIEELGLERYDE